MADTQLVPEAELNDYLGYKVLPRRFGINIFIADWNGRRLLDRADVLNYLQTCVTSIDSSPLQRIHDELADITAKGE